MNFSLVSLIVLWLAMCASAEANRFGRMVPSKLGAALDDRSNLGAKWAKPSLNSLPNLVHHQGIVQVKSANGTSLGYIVGALNVAGYCGLGPNKTNAAVISFFALRSRLTYELSLKVHTPPGTNATYFGAVIPRNFTLVPGALNGGTTSGSNNGSITSNVDVTVVGHTLPNSSPRNVSSGAANAASNNFTSPIGGGSATALDGESGIWTFDPLTSQWNATWQNYDGSRVPTIPYYDPDSAATGSPFTLVANATDYVQSHPNAQAVSLSLFEE